MEAAIKSFCNDHTGVKQNTNQWETTRKGCVGGSDYSAFCNDHTGVKQNTNQWETTRKGCVGGSDYSAIIGQNYFSSYSKKLTEKTSNEGVHFSAPCLWGTTFEEVAIAVLEKVYDTKVYGNNIYIEGGATAYSQDGFCVLPIRRAGVDAVCLGHPEEVVLLEIKCPYTRSPGRVIPNMYKPQVLLGLHHSPVATIGVFVDCVFRLCSFEDLGRAEAYNQVYHKDQKKYKETVAWGWASIEGLEDGDYSANGRFNSCLGLEQEHHGPWLGRPSGTTERPTGAFYYWKLFTMRLITARPDPDFIEKNHAKVAQFIQDLNRVKNGTYSDGRRYLSLNDLYGD